MYKHEVRVVGASAEEAGAAKDFWSQTENQGKEYGSQPLFYARILARLIHALAPESVFEFGCNAGRNLALLQSLWPHDSGPRLVGVDVNPQSISFGTSRFEMLELHVADETYLADQPDGAFEIAFTISVLDHLPVVDEALAELARVTSRYIIVLEPHGDQVGRVEEHAPLGSDGEWTEASPFSYVHDYSEAFGRLPVTERLNVPLPTGLSQLGPMYRLRVFEKNDTRESDPAIDWIGEHDHILREAIFDFLRLQTSSRDYKKRLKALHADKLDAVTQELQVVQKRLASTEEELQRTKALLARSQSGPLERLSKKLRGLTNR